MYPRGGGCTVSVTYPIYGFAAEKDITKVVSDGEINPMQRNSLVWLLICAVVRQSGMARRFPIEKRILE